jgi:phosphatidylglycerophosphatase A
VKHPAEIESAPHTDLGLKARAAAGGAIGRGGPPWATLTATFFGVGRLRPGPGSWASATTVLLWAAGAHFVPLSRRTPLAIALAVLITLIGIPAATRVARASAQKDPQFVVIDEVAGQLIALIAVPLSWKSLLAGFILFRAFDIIKPPPVRQLEALPEGAGIMLDDVAAGICALAGVHLLLHFGLLIT